MNSSGAVAFCLEILIIDSVSLIDLSPFKLSDFSHVSFDRCVLQRIGPFCLSYQVYEHRVVQNFHYYSFNVHRICNDISSHC
jgi:hypothetical protein